MNQVQAKQSSISSPIKRLDDRINIGNMSGTLATESDNTDSLFDESVIESVTSELLESLQAMDESKSSSSWKSETSIRFGSTSCTSTQSDVSISDSDSALDLEEALMKALFADNESVEMVEMPSELIVPYPDESGACQRRPTPWDSSSSETTNSSSRILSLAKAEQEGEAARTYGEAALDKPTSSDNRPLVPKRRRSNDALSNNVEDTPMDFPRRRSSQRTEQTEESVSMPDELCAFLMSRLPQSIVSKLNQSDWSRVCSEMENFTRSSGAVEALEKEQQEPEVQKNQVDDVESCSIVSELTGATGLTGLMNEETNEDDVNSLESISPLTSPTAQHEKLGAHNLSSRAWHDSSKCLSDAPKMPIRRRGLDRTNSEPRSQHKFPRGFSRSSSLPCDLVSVNRRTVSFDTVQVRHYEPVLDLNPSTSSGPSLGLGWNYFVDNPRKVTDVEDEKDRYGRRSMKEIIIPRHIREQTLKECGYTAKEIARGVRMNLKSKADRMRAVHNYKLDQIVEKSSRQVRRLFNPSRYAQQSSDESRRRKVNHDL